jgi:ATP-dependent DNA helicase UvrD/PcrA
MIKLPDTNSDISIRACIETSQSFHVVAGAGSGKTTSLVKALEHVRGIFGDRLIKNGQRVACITFTNRAVDVIKHRLKSDELFVVSTMHSFLWRLVGSFNSNIKETLINQFIPEKIAKKSEEDNGGTSKKAIAARKAIEEYQQDIIELDKVAQFDYRDGNHSDYQKGILGHDDVIRLSVLMMLEYSALQAIVGQKFPFIFLDEAQDTHPGVVEALNKICEKDGLPIIGYFGDPMQQIYDKRAGNFTGPEGSIFIPKEENFRCSTEVISLLNKFRTDIQQIPGPNNKLGSVKIRLIQAEEGVGYRKSYSDEQLERVNNKFDDAIAYFGWDDLPDVKRLFLARQMIARKLAFVSLHKLFTGKYASSRAQEDYESGDHFLLKPFIKVLAPLVTAYTNENKFSPIKILRDCSPILNPKGQNENSSVGDVIAEAEEVLVILIDMWSSKKLGEILRFSRDKGLINVSDRLSEHLDREPRLEEYDDETFSQEKGDWLVDEFFQLDTGDLIPYMKFIQDETPFSTQHGVKGEEYQKVLVLFDDTEANWSTYSFSKLLAPVASGKEPTDGQRKRSYRLAYVCFSRAEEDLRIILFTLDPNQAKKELLDSELFKEEQISIDS